MQPAALLPEIVLLLGALAVLMAGSFLPRRRLGWTAALTVAVLAGSAATSAGALGDPDQTVFSGTYTVDTATGAARLIAVVGAAIVVLLAADELHDNPRQAELCSLLLLATLGAVVLAGANDLLLLVAAFLLASIPLYALVGLTASARAAEAAMKTYFFGSFFGILLMVGVTVLYGVSGTTAYPELLTTLPLAPTGAMTFGVVAVFAGLMFKAGGVPGHFWVPDAAQGTSSFAAAYLTTIPKVGALVAAYRLVLVLPSSVHAPLLVAVLAVLSMTLGNLAAYGQDDPRRLLGWSTVSQVGYLLVPVAVATRTTLALPGLLVYLAGYVVTNLAAFAVVAAVPSRRTLEEYTGLFHSRPWLSASLLVSLLGLVGTPPTAVFVGKLAVATAAWDAQMPWLTVALLLNSVLSLFYYLRWLAPMIRTGPPVTTAHPRAQHTAIATSAASLTLGLLSAGLWQLFSNAPGG